jgi:hypothetical protein
MGKIFLHSKLQPQFESYDTVSCHILPCFELTFNIELWRPIFIIALYVIVLWRQFNCVKIPQSGANKIRESLE